MALRGTALLIGATLFSTTSPMYAAPSPPTFSKDVAPIVQQHCQSCHRPGEAAPFPC